jgi:hypothetical protein
MQNQWKSKPETIQPLFGISLILLDFMLKPEHEYHIYIWLSAERMVNYPLLQVINFQQAGRKIPTKKEMHQ